MSGNIDNNQHGSSVTSDANPSNGDGINANRVIDGEAEEMNEFAFKAVAPSDGPGNIVGTHVKKGGKLHVVSKGGMELIGGNAKDREKMARIQAETHKAKIAAEAERNKYKVKVSVKYPNYTGRHEDEYLPDQPLYDVIVDICKKETDKKFKEIVSKSGKVIDEDTKISALQKDGLLEGLTVIFH